MSSKTILGIMLTLLTCGMFMLAFSVQSGRADGTIIVPDHYSTIQAAINAANPGDTIFVRAKTYYENLIVDKAVLLIGENRRDTVIDGNETGIVVNVTASNVVINGFTIRNGGFESGVFIYGCSNVTVKNSTITNNYYGICLSESNNNTITENSITANTMGINLRDSSVNNTISRNIIKSNEEAIVVWSSNNTICKNCITNNSAQGIRVEDSNNIIYENNLASNGAHGGYGVTLYSYNNTVFRNNIVDNIVGLYLFSAYGNYIFMNNITDSRDYGLFISAGSDNAVYHNNFINNRMQVYNYYAGNIWDDGYPSGGNYWSDYIDSDLYSGSSQNITGSDGIGDMPNYLSRHAVDNYPLMGPINTFDAGSWSGESHVVQITSNSTISSFQLNRTEKVISFNVAGMDYTFGFCRVIIPNVIVEEMWQENYMVLINGELYPFRNWTDAANTYIYIDYTHSEHKIIIVPEFPSSLTLPLLMVFTTLAVVFTRRKIPGKPKI